MSIQLPKAIELYLAAENSGDVEVLAQCFAPKAVVHDEKRTYRGLTAIRAWKAGTKQKYQHSVEPLEIGELNGKTVVKVKLSGNFPGSPITVNFDFTLEHGRIASLEIRS